MRAMAMRKFFWNPYFSVKLKIKAALKTFFNLKKNHKTINISQSAVSKMEGPKKIQIKIGKSEKKITFAK